MNDAAEIDWYAAEMQARIHPPPLIPDSAPSPIANIAGQNESTNVELNGLDPHAMSTSVKSANIDLGFTTQAVTNTQAIEFQDIFGNGTSFDEACSSQCSVTQASTQMDARVIVPDRTGVQSSSPDSGFRLVSDIREAGSAQAKPFDQSYLKAGQMNGTMSLNMTSDLGWSQTVDTSLDRAIPPQASSGNLLSSFDVVQELMSNTPTRFDLPVDCTIANSLCKELCYWPEEDDLASIHEMEAAFFLDPPVDIQTAVSENPERRELLNSHTASGSLEDCMERTQSTLQAAVLDRDVTSWMSQNTTGPSYSSDYNSFDDYVQDTTFCRAPLSDYPTDTTGLLHRCNGHSFEHQHTNIPLKTAKLGASAELLHKRNNQLSRVVHNYGTRRTHSLSSDHIFHANVTDPLDIALSPSNVLYPAHLSSVRQNFASIALKPPQSNSTIAAKRTAAQVFDCTGERTLKKSRRVARPLTMPGYNEFVVRLPGGSDTHNSRYGKKLSAAEKDTRKLGACVRCRYHKYRVRQGSKNCDIRITDLGVKVHKSATRSALPPVREKFDDPTQ